MTWSVDARVPVLIGEPEAGPPGAALLLEGDTPAPAGHVVARFWPEPAGHAVGCACCVPRGAVARALSVLFLARARGETGLFPAVVAVVRTEAAHAAVLETLACDPMVRGRFRLAEIGPA